MPKIKIEKLYTSEVKTKYGLKQKLSVYNDKGVRFDAWQSEWTKDWKIGGEIEVTEDQAEKREYNGKVYYQLKAPASARGGFVNFQEIGPKLDEILSNQSKILKLLEGAGVTKPGPKNSRHSAPSPSPEPPAFDESYAESLEDFPF